MADRPHRRLRRFEHPRVLLGVAVILLAALAGSFAAGRFVRAPDRAGLKAATQPIHVYARVTERIVDSREAYTAIMSAGSEAGMTVETSVDPAVVTRQPFGAGDAFAVGAMIGVVSGQPYFALPGPLPLYRDLHSGDSGDDVSCLQRSLSALGHRLRASGKIDGDTMAAVRAVFAAQGFSLPRDASSDGASPGTPRSTDYIPFREFVSAPVANAAVISAAPVGTRLAEGTPLVTLRTSANVARFRADAVTAGELKVGAPLSLRDGEVTHPVTVSRIGPFTAGGNGQIPGSDIDLTSADPAFDTIPIGRTVAVLAAGTAEKSLAVPLTALRQDNDGDYVLRATARDGRTAVTRVRVSVTRTGGGWAAVRNGPLHPGDRIRVS